MGDFGSLAVLCEHFRDRPEECAIALSDRSGFASCRLCSIHEEAVPGVGCSISTAPPPPPRSVRSISLLLRLIALSFTATTTAHQRRTLHLTDSEPVNQPLVKLKVRSRFMQFRLHG